MAGGDVAGPADEAIAVVGDIVLHVAVAALSDLNVGAVGVGRPEIGNS